MAFPNKLYNLARMTTATVGTGTLTLGAAVAGFLTFALAGVADGDVVSYCIRDGANSEHGSGTYTAIGTTLTRTVVNSTNGNALISLSGSAQVAISPLSGDLQPTGAFAWSNIATVAIAVNAAFTVTSTATPIFTQSTATWAATFSNSHATAGDFGVNIGCGGTTAADVSSLVMAFYVSGISGGPVGTISRNGLAVLYNTTSDKRLKEDPREFDGLKICASLQPWDFRWKDTDRRQYGFFAQDEEGKIPSHVTKPANPKHYWSTSDTAVVPVLVRAVNQLLARVEALESALAAR